MNILVSRHIEASPARVTAIMFDPRRDPEWIGGASAVDPAPGAATEVGARTRRRGAFLGRKFSWVTQVLEHEPERYLRMAFVEGPMRGEVSYRIEPEGNGSRVSIRNQGGASFALPFMAWFLRRSVAKDLQRLERLVEKG